MNELAEKYIKALLSNDRYSASRLILDAVEAGTPIKGIYKEVFQESQYEIGRLWQNNRISVAQEHYCTAATQLIMSQLYPYIFTGDKNGRKMVAACVGGELHEIGVRMLADFFEMEGWDTYFLGANTPAEGIIQTIRDNNADILAVSASMTFNISAVKDLIAEVRKADGIEYVKIIVGGRPFNVAPDLWKSVGADTYAPDAETALSAASEVLKGKTGRKA